MTEQEAIERIKTALDYSCGCRAAMLLPEQDIDELAKTAWNEMKAIALEESQSEQAAHERTLADIGRAAILTCEQR